jgi:hypothetical protein
LTIDRLVNFSAARKRLANIRDHMFGPIRQAEVLSERIRGKHLSCSGNSLELLDHFVTCLEQGVIRRLWTIYQSPLRRQGPWRKLLLFFRVLLMRNDHEMKHVKLRDQHDPGVLLQMTHNADGAPTERSQGWRFLASIYTGSRGVRIRTEEKI